MKPAYLAAALISVLPSLTARANVRYPDQMVTEVVCNDLHAGPDFGTTVVIRSGGIAGITLATVAAQSIAGPRPIGTYAVRKQLPPRGLAGAPLRYVGLAFELAINGSVRPLPGGIYSVLTIDRGQAGRIRTELSCCFVTQAGCPSEVPGL